MDNTSAILRTPNILRESAQGIAAIPIKDALFERREIECVGPIDRDMTYSLCQQLLHLMHEGPADKITIYFNSPGGEVTSGLAIYDVMKAVSCPIRTVCLGMAASMAALLFMAGDERDMLPHARVMIHDPLVSGGIGGSALDIQTAAEGIMRTREITAQIIAEHTGRPLEEVFAATAHDSYFEAVEAIEWGLADRIIDTL